MNLDTNELTCEKVSESVASSVEPKKYVNDLRTSQNSDCNKSNIEPLNIAKRRRMQTETELASLLSNSTVQCSSLTPSSLRKQNQTPPSLTTTSNTKCNKCNKQFNTEGGLNIHISKKHKV
jgi:hypothetical protein